MVDPQPERERIADADMSLNRRITIRQQRRENLVLQLQRAEAHIVGVQKRMAAMQSEIREIDGASEIVLEEFTERYQLQEGDRIENDGRIIRAGAGEP